MSHNYQCNEFIFDSNPNPVDVAVDKKVSLLYELCVLVMNKEHHDPREDALRKVLSNYTSERSLTTALHDVVVGNKPLDTFLAQRGLM
jgi:hypothetical protein